MKNTLILNYLHFSSAKIGAKRWRNISNEIIKYRNIQVLFSDFDSSNPINKETLFKSNYFRILDRVSRTFLEKIKYRLAYWVNMAFGKGTPYDKALFDKKQVLKSLVFLFSNFKFNELIVSGAPFNLCYYAAIFKSNNSKIKLIVDFRDPWTWGEGYGISGLSEKRFAWENHKEHYCISQADLITVPSESMKKFLIKKYPEYVEKFYLFPHGTNIIGTNRNKTENCIVDFIYGGTVYPETFEDITKVFDESFDQNVQFYCSNNLQFEEVLLNKKLTDGIVVNPQMEEYRFIAELCNSNYYLAFFPERYKDFISTKFIEIIALKIPIILMSPKGVLSDFIESNNLGIHFENDILGRGSLKNFLKKPTEILDYNSKFDISSYKWSTLTKELIDKIEEAKPLSN